MGVFIAKNSNPGSAMSERDIADLFFWQLHQAEQKW